MTPTSVLDVQDLIILIICLDDYIRNVEMNNLKYCEGQNDYYSRRLRLVMYFFFYPNYHIRVSPGLSVINNVI